MKKKLKWYIWAGILFTSITGTLSHFVYEWSGKNTLAGFFTPVNESTWEHMKMLFFPMLLFFIVLCITFYRTYPGIVQGGALGILFGTISIPVIFYTYSGILGKNYLWLDIATFFAAVLIAFTKSYRLALHYDARRSKYTFFALTCVILLFAAFISFTYHPPGLNLFR